MTRRNTQRTSTAPGPSAELGAAGGTGPRVFVPIDSGALSVGAEAVARAIVAEAARRGDTIRLVRNGSRGLYWLEPLVEVETAAGRLAYGPVQAADVPGLFAAGFLDEVNSPGPRPEPRPEPRPAPRPDPQPDHRPDPSARHPLALGRVDEIPWLKNQERLTFARVGVIDPLSIDDYVALDGFAGLQRALTIGALATVRQVTDSGLRGRGGAAFPTGIKWHTVLDAPAPAKYVVCNADEGDSGTFSDRMLMEGDPYCLIEGMAIAGVAAGATQGYIYLRSEYPHAFRTLQAAIANARAAGYLGDDLLGSGQSFDLEVRLGAGAYICGEETAMLESLEGRRGVVRAKPPLPAIAGLFGRPTVINNVITLASVPTILAQGSAFYRDFGQGRSRGTLPFQLAGNLQRTGLVEKAFGLTLRELLYDFGGGAASGRPLRAVQVGGPLGAYLPPEEFDVRLDYEAYTNIGAMIGHGGVVAFDDTVDMARMARYAMAFCAEESCGKCTPCRIGSTRGVEVIDRIIAGKEREKNLALLESLCDTLLHGSLCALGGLTPYPVLSALKHFPEDFGREP